MTPNHRVSNLALEVIAWRKRLHANPELGFQEHETAAFVADKLRGFGLEVHTGVSATAVVGILRRGAEAPAIALRAELDALPIDEKTGLDCASRNPGIMHACGHDGHMAILLGTAKLLAESETLDRTVVLVFQPAEETLGGGRKLVEDGFLERFPVEEIYALHNWPGLAEGVIAVREGPQMAAVDDFEARFRGAGCHAAMPHKGDDPILAAAGFVQAAQRVASRSVDPLSPFVLSITQIHAGRFNNFVPGGAVVEGTCRFYDADLSIHAEAEIERTADGVAAAHGVSDEVIYKRGYPPVVNPTAGAGLVAEAAREALGDAHVTTEFPPSLGCEDFAFLLNAVGQGAYAWIGAGDAAPGAGLHGERYVFNDAVIEPAMRVLLEIVARRR